MRLFFSRGQANVISLMILVSAVVILGLASWYLFLSFIIPQRMAVDIATLTSRAAATLRLSVVYEEPSSGLYVVQLARTVNENVLLFVTLIADTVDGYSAVPFSVSIPSSPVASINSNDEWYVLPSIVSQPEQVMYIDPGETVARYIPLSVKLKSPVVLYYLTVNTTPVMLRIKVSNIPSNTRGLWLFIAVQVSDRFYVVTTQLLGVTASS
ncbi:MAG: hypothetical protein DRO12_05935 [Thermoprotei archaeon]|nr:MAG: hypothetical protein DRO12_05935 [Thermoprotei archaeon]